MGFILKEFIFIDQAPIMSYYHWSLSHKVNWIFVIYERSFLGMLHMYLSHCKSQNTLQDQVQALLASRPLNEAISLHQDDIST